MADLSNLLTDTTSLARRIADIRTTTTPAHVQEILRGADEWAISADVAQVLDFLVAQLAPQSVLEFGAGRSSLVLAAALHNTGGGRLTSVEHAPEFSASAWQKVRQFHTVDAQLVTSGLRLRPSRHGLLHEYAGIDAALRARGPFDFVFVDAPPGHFGRDTTLLTAAPYLAAEAIIVLDDAARVAERTAVRRWERAVPIERVFEDDAFGRGITVLRITGSATPSFSLRTFIGTIHDRVVAWRNGVYRRR